MKAQVTLTAHRGWRAKYPENTMRGFREAMKLDIDGVETDVHMTADYHIVVCHDARLDRTTDKKGSINCMTLKEIREADAGIKFGEEFRGEKIPTFEEFLEVSLTVDEPLREMTEEVPEKEEANPFTIFLTILCALLIAGLITQHLILTGKIHKLEEDRL